jgi:hypothetical protein
MSQRPTLPTSPIPTLRRLDRGWVQLEGPAAVAARIEDGEGDGLILEWGDEPQGLFPLLQRAERAGRVVLPARWFPARPEANGGFGDEGRLLWVARSDGALRRLLSDLDLADDLDGAARATEPLALLGAPGDVVRLPRTQDPVRLRRRAQRWVGRLGADRVVLAVVGDEDPLASLGEEWGLPVVHLVDAEARGLPRRTGAGRPPLLWTDFQLDREHRLPDDGYVAGLRDLLHRGSLLRERCLYEKLPPAWRDAAEAELRALHAWRLGPMLRRISGLVQTLSPLPGVTVEAPLPAVGGVVAWILGLSERRPLPEGRPGDPAAAATGLAAALDQWDRRLTARVRPRAWPRLQGRLAPWLEGGHLAACPEAASHPGRRFCFSGRPLYERLPLGRDRDGVPRVRLHEADRRALGWFELELRLDAKDTKPDVAPPRADVHDLPMRRAGCDEQLGLDLEGMGGLS